MQLVLLARKGILPSRFSIIQKGGKGSEVDISTKARPGRWKICVHLYKGVRETIQELKMRASDFSKDLAVISIRGKKHGKNCRVNSYRNSGNLGLQKF